MRQNLFTSALVLVSVVRVGLVNAQVRQGEPHKLLRIHVGLSEGELQAMDEGKVIVKVLDIEDNREVAIVGVARIRATTDFFLRMFRDVEKFDTGASQIKKVSDPPRPEDFANMRIPDDDLKSLEKCTVDDCDMKLGQPALEELQREIDWKSADATAGAQDLLRRRAYAYADAYRRGGAAALGVYRDKAKPSFIADSWITRRQLFPAQRTSSIGASTTSARSR